MRIIVTLLSLALSLGACGNEAIKPTTLEPMLLPDGTTVGGAQWARDGGMMSTRTTALFRCRPDNSDCQALSAGTSEGPGYMAVAASMLHGAIAGMGGAMLLPKPTGGGGVFVNAPETFVQTNVGLAK